MDYPSKRKELYCLRYQKWWGLGILRIHNSNVGGSSTRLLTVTSSKPDFPSAYIDFPLLINKDSTLEDRTGQLVSRRGFKGRQCSANRDLDPHLS